MTRSNGGRVGRRTRQGKGTPDAFLKSLARSYGAALVFVGAALFATLFVQRFFPYPFLFLFFAAVMASAWLGGPAAGLFAVLASTILVDYFFVPPFNSFDINATDVSYFVAFVLCALVASWVSSSKKKDELALKDARDQMEIRVKERTAMLQKSNEELRESEHQLRLITEVIPQQIWSGKPDGFIDYCNQPLLDYAGRAITQMQGDRFMETLHPEDRRDFEHSWHHALSAAEPFEGEWRFRGANGGYRQFFTRAVPLKGDDGKTLRWYGTNTDIEQRKQTEQALMKTQTELAHLSRALTMGELTASIAHEVNQPLTAVVTYANACLEWLASNPPNLAEARHAAETVIKDGTRAGMVLGRIRSLFQKEAPSKDLLDMNEVIRELAVFLREEAMRQHISVRMDLDPALPKIKGDRVQLQQVVLNLAVNAMEAMRSPAIQNKEMVIRSAREAAKGIRILVEDCGMGFDPDVSDKMFNPFFTTKAKGTGMGLSISRSIVESHEGRLWAVPRPSGGAIFQFIVPIGN